MHLFHVFVTIFSTLDTAVAGHQRRPSMGSCSHSPRSQLLSGLEIPVLLWRALLRTNSPDLLSAAVLALHNLSTTDDAVEQLCTAAEQTGSLNAAKSRLLQLLGDARLSHHCKQHTRYLLQRMDDPHKPATVTFGFGYCPPPARKAVYPDV